MENALEYFSVFGGLEEEIDLEVPLYTLIKDNILDNYDHYHQELIETTLGDRLYHSVLTGLAMGDAQSHTAFKRARITKEAGQPALDFLVQHDILTCDSSPVISSRQLNSEENSDKYNFDMPFLRFWFAFVSPLFKGIVKEEYEEIKERFNNRKAEFPEQVYAKLAQEYLFQIFKDDAFIDLGAYWDREFTLDILGKTTSGKVVAGICRYSNAKMKKAELTKLQDMLETLGLKADILVLFSKRGFSNELKALKNENLRLYSVKNLKSLLA